MTIDQLKAMMAKRPFRQFTLRLADGSRVSVTHPELVLVVPPGRTIIVATGYESFEIIDLLLVAAIEVGNGRSRRRKA